MIYKVKVGNYVNFEVAGNVVFSERVCIRDFSEIIVPRNAHLHLGKQVFIGRSVEIGAKNIYIDKNTSVQNSCILLGEIVIGKECLLASNIYISSGKHHFDFKPELYIHDQDRLMVSEKSGCPIIIEDDVWIGKNTVIINGVTIGKGAIIGANSFINKDVFPYTIVAGTPQKLISHRLEFDEGIVQSLDCRDQVTYPYLYSGIDYSLDTINRYALPIIEKEIFVLVLSQDKRYKYLVLEIESDEKNVIMYGNQTKQIEVMSNSIEFCIEENYNTKFIFQLNNINGIIKIKKVFLHD